MIFVLRYVLLKTYSFIPAINDSQINFKIQAKKEMLSYFKLKVKIYTQDEECTFSKWKRNVIQ